MTRKKKAPRSQHRVYQTPSRSVRQLARPKNPPTWLLVGAPLALVVAVVALLVLRQRSEPQVEQPLAERPLAALSPAERNNYYSSPPEMQIDTSQDYQARIITEKGEILVDLYEQLAPITVNNFVFLARQGFYDGVTFHRVLDGFMAQGGDPSGSGAGGPGYQFQDETANELVFDRAGLLAMANSGADTNGSQFFITFAPTPHLNGKHTIFGEVMEGAPVLDLLTRRDPQANPDFAGDVIEKLVILQDGIPS